MPKGFYTHGDYWGWMPSKSGFGGRYERFETIDEYWEAYAEATAS